MQIEIDQSVEDCPFRAGGQAEGQRFCLRARGPRWTIGVGGRDLTARLGTSWVRAEDVRSFMRGMR